MDMAKDIEELQRLAAWLDGLATNALKASRTASDFGEKLRELIDTGGVDMPSPVTTMAIKLAQVQGMALTLSALSLEAKLAANAVKSTKTH